MTDKNYKFLVPGGGVFSRLLQCAIIPLSKRDFDNVYLSPSHFWLEDSAADPSIMKAIVENINHLKEYGIDDPYDHLFNYFLEQKTDENYIDCGILEIGTLYTSQNKIELSSFYQDYKHVVSKLKFKQSLISEINRRSKNINWEKTLGVHIRLTTIAIHGHDHATFEDYVRAIEFNLRNYNFDTIFVSSDNDESVDKLINYFGSMIKYNKDFQRLLTENNHTNLIWEYQSYFKRFYWNEAIIDCMMLAKAKKLICRTSNFSNAAIVFGNYEQIQRL